MSDKSPTVSRDGSRTPEVLNVKVVAESKPADVAAVIDETANAVAGRRAINSARLKIPTGIEQSTAGTAADVKPDVSKMGLPSTVTTRPVVVQQAENTRPRQPNRTPGTMPDSTRNVRPSSEKATQGSRPARNGRQTFVASLTAEKYGRVEPRRPTSSRPAAVDVVESRSGDLRRRRIAGARPPVKSDSREKSPTTNSRGSRAPADSTSSTHEDVSCNDDVESRVDSS